MKWHLITEKQPEFGIDVLVCFDPSNPFSCDVCRLESNDEDEYIWWRSDMRNYAAEPTDYWAEIPMPQPRIPAYKEED